MLKQLANIIFSRNGIVVLLAFAGFIFTAVIAFPYGVHWDAGYLFSFTFTSGSVHCNNWMGWYFPWLWKILYQFTGFDCIIGTYIQFIYWISMTLLFCSVFTDKKLSPFLFIPFAFFPPALLFIDSITNNALLFVTLLLGIALYFLYRRIRKMYWLILSLFFIIQCIFIRCEAIFFIFPLLFVLFFLEARKKYLQKTAVVIAFLLVVTCILLPIMIEAGITKKIHGWHHINTISYTALWDLTCMSYYKGECLIPVSCRNQMISDQQCMERLKNYKKINDALRRDVACFQYWEQIGIGWDRYLVKIKLSECISLYLKNIRYYVKHRSRIIWAYLTEMPDYCYPAEKIDGYTARSISKLLMRMEKLWNNIAPYQFIFSLYLLFLFLVASWKKITFFEDMDEKIFICSLSLCCLIGIGIVFLSVLAIQMRYLTIYCCLIYYICFITFLRTFLKIHFPKYNS